MGYRVYAFILNMFKPCSYFTLDIKLKLILKKIKNNVNVSSNTISIITVGIIQYYFIWHDKHITPSTVL